MGRPRGPGVYEGLGDSYPLCKGRPKAYVVEVEVGWRERRRVGTR